MTARMEMKEGGNMSKRQMYETQTEHWITPILERNNFELVDVEYVNDAEAISEYYYAQYTYNAALRVGSSILGPSLLDFLK